MTLEVVYAQRRPTPGIGKSATEAAPDQQCPGKPGARRKGDRVDPPPVQARLGEHIARQLRQFAHMVAGGELGHDPAPGRMEGGLAVHAVREQAAVGRVNRHRRLVTGRLDAQDFHRSARPGGPGRTPALIFIEEILKLTSLFAGPQPQSQS